MVPFAVYGGSCLCAGAGSRCIPLLAQVVAVTITAAYAYGTTRFRAPAELVLVRARRCRRRSTCNDRPHDGSRRRRAPEPGDDPSAFVHGRAGCAVRPAARRGGRSACVAVVVALPLRGLYRTPARTMEEGFMLAFPERMLKGAVPNVDFLHLYGPGSLRRAGRRGTRSSASASTSSDVRPAPAHRPDRRDLRARPGLGPVAGGGCALLRDVPGAHPDRPVGAGLERRRRARAVERGARAAGCAPGSSGRWRWWVAAGVLAGCRPRLPARPGDRARPRARLAAVAAAGARAVGPAAASASPSGCSRCSSTWSRRASDRRARHGHRPRVQAARRAQLPRPPSWGHIDGALQAIAEKVPPCVAVAGAARPAPAVPLVLPAADRRPRRARSSVVAPSRPPRRARRSRAARRRAVRRRPAPPGLPAPGPRPLRWVSCVCVRVAAAGDRRGARPCVRAHWRPRGARRHRGSAAVFAAAASS